MPWNPTLVFHQWWSHVNGELLSSPVSGSSKALPGAGCAQGQHYRTHTPPPDNHSSSEFFSVNIHLCWRSRSAREAEEPVGAYVETWAHASKAACLVDVKFPRCVSANTHKVCGVKTLSGDLEQHTVLVVENGHPDNSLRTSRKRSDEQRSSCKFLLE